MRSSTSRFKIDLVIKVLLSLIISECESARILAVVPTPAISHQVVFRPLTQKLARRGHEVVVITTDPAFPKGETPANLTEIDFHDISYDYFRKNFRLLGKGWAHDPVTHMVNGLELFNDMFEFQVQTKDFQGILKQSFDLVVVEMCVRAAYILSHVFKAPMILMSSAGAGAGVYDIVGAPTHPFLYPALRRQRIYNLTLSEKLNELYKEISFAIKYSKAEEKIDVILKRNFGPNVPEFHKLKDNVDLIFLNIHPIFEGNYPVPPTVIYVGGIHEESHEELSEDLKSYLEKSKNGIIYISFGTTVDPSILPVEKVEMLVRVLSQLPYDVLWKWDKDDSILRSLNIKTGKWFPQASLLKNPNVKLFITQGGIQSTEEAIRATVPLIGIPMIAEQWYNTEKYEHLGIGKKLDLETLTDEEFKEAVLTVIENDSYKQNIIHLNTLFNDQPQSALQRAVWWTEYVLRHGGARHLRAPAANISWAQYLELELVLTLLSIVVLVLTISICVIYYCSCKLFKRKPVKLKKS